MLACLPVHAGELVCVGRADDLTQASVACFDPSEVRRLSEAFRFARLFASDSRSALRKAAGLLVDCAARRAYEVADSRIEDAAFAELARAVCAAKEGRR